MQGYLTIKDAAKRAGLTPKTIRYYEQIGLIPPFERSRAGFKANGYRLFTRPDINRLEFVKRARRLGLSLAQVKELLAATERGSASPELGAFIEQKLSEIDQTVRDLQSLRGALGEFRRRINAKLEKTPQSCCEPVCGPITCGPEGQIPSLVQIGKDGRLERR
jgi:DNA-binding transcriptional MerR regulator